MLSSARLRNSLRNINKDVLIVNSHTSNIEVLQTESNKQIQDDVYNKVENKEQKLASAQGLFQKYREKKCIINHG